MKNDGFDRRAFLKSAMAGSAVAATANIPPPAQAQPTAAQSASTGGYAFLNAEEAAFIEALVDHMVPADELTPKGTDIGLDIFIDRALAGGWGKGDRLYMQGPWKQGVPEPGLSASDDACGSLPQRHRCRQFVPRKIVRQISSISSAKLSAKSFLLNLDKRARSRSRWTAGARLFTTVYQSVMEGMFSDPMYGGNRRTKPAGSSSDFPGVIQVNQPEHREIPDKQLPVDPIGIADMS